MAESLTELQSRLAATTIPGFRERLVDRGLARGLIWREGVLPAGSPPLSGKSYGRPSRLRTRRARNGLASSVREC